MEFQIIQFDDPAWRDPQKPVPADLKQLVRDHFIRPKGQLLLAVAPENPVKVLGTAGFRYITDDVCEAKNVVVGWDYQSKGVGRELLKALFREARMAGYLGMRAEVPDNVPALVQFFEKHGFSRTASEFQRPGFVRLECRLMEQLPA